MAERKLAYYTNDDLINKTDNELVASAKNGNEEALECLFNKYKELVNMKVSKYFIIGAENIANLSGFSFAKLFGVISPNNRTTIVVTTVEIAEPTL